MASASLISPEITAGSKSSKIYSRRSCSAKVVLPIPAGPVIITEPSSSSLDFAWVWFIVLMYFVAFSIMSLTRNFERSYIGLF